MFFTAKFQVLRFNSQFSKTILSIGTSKVMTYIYINSSAIFIAMKPPLFNSNSKN